MEARKSKVSDKDDSEVKGNLSESSRAALLGLKQSLTKPVKLTQDEKETERLKVILERLPSSRSAFYLPQFELGVVQNFVTCRFKGDLFTLRNKFPGFKFHFLANTSVLKIPILFADINLLQRVNLDYKYGSKSGKHPRRGDDLQKYKKALYAPTIEYPRWMELAFTLYLDVLGEWENLSTNRYRPVSFDKARVCKGYWMLPLMPRSWMDECGFNLLEWGFLSRDFIE